MKPTWQIRRQLVEHRDGQRRWDQSYQHLVRWAPMPQEVSHERRDVCPCLNDAASPSPHDRTITESAARLCPAAGVDV